MRMTRDRLLEALLMQQQHLTQLLEEETQDEEGEDALPMASEGWEDRLAQAMAKALRGVSWRNRTFGSNY